MESNIINMNLITPKSPSIGSMSVLNALPYLQSIAKDYELKLNNPYDFKIARLILANRYSNIADSFFISTFDNAFNISSSFINMVILLEL